MITTFLEAVYEASSFYLNGHRGFGLFSLPVLHPFLVDGLDGLPGSAATQPSYIRGYLREDREAI